MNIRRRLKRLEDAAAKGGSCGCRIELIENWDNAALPPLPPCPQCDRVGQIRRIELTLHDGDPRRPLHEVASC